MNDYIRSLLAWRLSNYNVGDRITARLDQNAVNLPITKALPCGLIINELVTNSFIHAFPDFRTGTVIVSLKQIENDGEETMVLSVSDNGVGFPDAVHLQDSDTLGFQMVRILVEQLNSTASVTSIEGTSVFVRFPVLL